MEGGSLHLTRFQRKHTRVILLRRNNQNHGWSFGEDEVMNGQFLR
jgi:hypothetical protein